MERALAEMRKRSLCHASRAPDRLGFAVAIPDDRPEPRPVRRAHVDEWSCLMAAHLADSRPFGNHLSGWKTLVASVVSKKDQKLHRSNRAKASEIKYRMRVA